MTSPTLELKPGVPKFRRVSLPTPLPFVQQRTQKSLSPRAGFLKEISEFNIDPPFISPVTPSSSRYYNCYSFAHAEIE